MPTPSISERRKRSPSPTRDDRRDRRRKYEDAERDRDAEKYGSDRGYFPKKSSKRSLDEEIGGSKYQKNYHGTSRSKRVQDEDDDDAEEKPTRTSRFVGERKQEDFGRVDANNGGRVFGWDSFDSQRQSYRNRSDMPPSRRDDYNGRSGFDGGFRNAGAGGGYSRRGSSFGRWSSGRGRGGGRGGRTVVYRPGEESEKPTMNLFDPSQVPKGRSYFEHEDRSSETNRRFRGRGRGRVGGGGRAASSYWQDRWRDYSGGSSEDVWRHDMFEEMETSDTQKSSSDVAMEEGK